MGIEIKDGTGSGYTVKVGADNRLSVTAESSTRLATISNENGRAFSAYLKHDITTGGGGDEILGILTNDNPSMSVYVEKLIITSGGTLSKVEAYFDATRTSGGSLRAGVNLNRSSANQSLLTVYDNRTDDLIIVTDDTLELLHVMLGVQTLLYEFGAAIILGPGNSIAFKCTGATTGDHIRLVLSYYEREYVGS